MKRLAIIGAGELGQQIAQHVTQIGAYQVAGFFDDSIAVGRVTQHGLVLGPIHSARTAFEQGVFDELLLGIGYKHIAARQRLYEELAAHIVFGRFVHPSTYVDPSATLGAGVFISPGCVLDLNVTLEANTFLYANCLISHDSLIGAHSFLAPGVRLAGRVQIASRCFLGIGTTIIDNCTLGPDVRTGGGTVVTRDLLEAGIYVGAPARKL
ncbi:acetyltransferase [Hymenobacter sp. GOD-10R]|uniref:acetyltransferase n=1 Tax=Hymenobacter sp. GOD-10R TaxID=3093922 RepID=UPI002D784AB7|nr:acetyltransferase [Hymenobacter sp. GOD-10R]WRQ29583.1 acetyltransferase [Hymenobacter sp. GOD-10R]